MWDGSFSSSEEGNKREGELAQKMTSGWLPGKILRERDLIRTIHWYPEQNALEPSSTRCHPRVG